MHVFYPLNPSMRMLIGTFIESSAAFGPMTCTLRSSTIIAFLKNCSRSASQRSESAASTMRIDSNATTMNSARNNLRMMLSILLLITARMVSAESCDSQPLDRLNAQVWVARATGEAGYLANLSVVELPRGMVIFSSAPGLHVSGKLRCAIAMKFRKPVLAIVLPQSLLENVLGSAAFPKARIIATTKTGKLMATRCPTCRKNFVERLGSPFEAITAVVAPNDLRDVSQRVDLGKGNFNWLVFDAANLAGNAALWHAKSGTLLTGALVTNAVVPDAGEADIDVWLAALEAMERLEPRYVVPDHGAPGDVALVKATRSYLRGLRDGVTRALAEGVDLAEVATFVDGAAFMTWGEFEARHGKNVRAEMLRREAVALRPHQLIKPMTDGR